MEQFYFQLAIIIFAFMITGGISWMAVNTWNMTRKVATFEIQFENVVCNIRDVSDDIKTMRKYDAIIAAQGIKIDGLDRRISEIEHSQRKNRRG